MPVRGAQLRACPPKGPGGGAGARLGVVRERAPPEVPSRPGPEERGSGISLLGAPAEPFILTPYVCLKVWLPPHEHELREEIHLEMSVT